jgi:putative PIN family toxin of toxin-antitoxin system
MQVISVGEICVSNTTLSELQQVLSRPKFDQYQSKEARDAFVRLVLGFAVLVPVSAGDEANVSPPCRDPKDSPFLALALACAADALISSDADLLVLHPWRGIPIISPKAYLLQDI